MEVEKISRIMIKVELTTLECSDISRICCEAMSAYREQGYDILSKEAKEYAEKLMKVIQ